MRDATLDKLAAFFPASEIQWLPKALSKDKTKGLAIPYIDAASVEDRLDNVLGITGWQTHYELLHDGNALCRLSVWCEEKKIWITKEDVGGPHSSMKDPASKIKSSFSDALKRAAVQFGIGRYLRSMPQNWYPVDQYGRFTSVPPVPKQFLPAPALAPAARPAQTQAPAQDTVQAQANEPTKLSHPPENLPIGRNPENWQAKPGLACPFVSEAQAVELAKLIREGGVDEGRFLNAYQISEINLLAAAAFEEAKAKLFVRVAEKKKRDSDVQRQEQEMLANAERLAQGGHH